MKLRDVMSADVRCVTPDTSLQAAAVMMKELDVGALPVCDGDRLTGMLTDRDLVIRGLAAGAQTAGRSVAEVMTQGVAWCFDDDSIDTAANLMQERQIRRLPVLSRDKRLVGIVSLGDLAVRANDDKLAGRTLEEISESAQTLATTD
jgi:CBS domain-containing protein